MFKYIFIGNVLPDSVRVNSPLIRVAVEASDCPSGDMDIQIIDSRIVVTAKMENELDAVAKATLYNIVNDVADSACSTGLLVEGFWAVANIDTCINHDGSIERRIVSASIELKEQFKKLGVTATRLEKIYAHSDGFYLRLAVDDIIEGIRKQKFIRGHFYRATESLCQSVAKESRLNSNNRNKWENFWEKLSINPDDFRTYIANHDERHANYSELKPLDANEKGKVFETAARILARYISWFEGIKGL